MGLSDEERYNKVAYIVEQLTSIKPFQHYEYKEFNVILKKLWNELLANSSNSAHWFMGSSSSSNSIGQVGIFGAAMLRAASELDLSKEDKALPTIDYFEFVPNTTKLLWSCHVNDGRGGEKSDIFSIFQLTESYFYAANRYDDKLSKSLSSLTEQICNLQGLCYRVFANDTDFIRAWMASAIFEKIFCYRLDNEDFVSKWYKDENIHHEIRFRHMNDKDLYETFKEFQKIKYFSTHDCLMAVLRFTKKDFVFDDLIKRAKLHNKDNPKDKIDIKEIEFYKDIVLKELAEKKKENAYDDSYCHLTQQFLKVKEK